MLPRFGNSIELTICYLDVRNEERPEQPGRSSDKIKLPRPFVLCKRRVMKRGSWEIQTTLLYNELKVCNLTNLFN